MSASILSEIRKLRSTRLWWILLLCMVLAVGLMTAFLGFAFAFAGDVSGNGTAEPSDSIQTARMIYALPISFGYVFPVILGALAVTAEFRHRTIDTTLLLQPSRVKVIAAKFVAVVPFALVYAVAAVVTGVAIGAGALALAGKPTGLDQADVWQTVGMGVLALTAWGLVGVGFGSAITNQIAVIVVLLGWTQLVEPLLRVAFGFFERLQGVGRFLPGAAGEAMAGASFYSATGAADLLSPWAGFAVLLGYAAVAGVIGWLITFRRDIA